MFGKNKEKEENQIKKKKSNQQEGIKLRIRVFFSSIITISNKSQRNQISKRKISKERKKKQ